MIVSPNHAQNFTEDNPFPTHINNLSKNYRSEDRFLFSMNTYSMLPYSPSRSFLSPSKMLRSPVVGGWGDGGGMVVRANGFGGGGVSGGGAGGLVSKVEFLIPYLK